LRLKFRALGLRIWKPRRLILLLSAESAESPLAGRTAEFSFVTSLLPGNSVPFREAEFVLGIAKLLPLVVPVKRETLQVVSLTMTGWCGVGDPVFHI